MAKGTKLNRVDHQDGNTSQTQCKQVKVGCSIYGISITIQYWYSRFTEIHIVLGFVRFCRVWLYGPMQGRKDPNWVW